MEEFNWTAIFIAAIVPLIFGGLWYSKSLYESITGDTSSNRKHSPIVYVLCYVFSIPIAFTLAAFHSGHDPAEQIWAHGAMHGTLLGILVIGMAMAIHFMFEGDRSIRNGVYHILYWIISTALIGAIVFAMS